MSDVSLAHAPSGAAPVFSAHGAAAGSTVIPSGAELVSAGLDYVEEEPNRCIAYKPDGGRCKNGHPQGGDYCGLHKHLEKE